MNKLARPDAAGLAIAGGLLAAAIVVAWDTTALSLNQTYGIGPKAMPYVIAFGLAVLSVANAVAAWTGALPVREDFDPKALVLILGGFALLIAIIAFGGGFIPATAVLFAATAAAFGRRAVLTDLAVGAGLGVVVFLLFDKLLTLALPAGPLERLF